VSALARQDPIGSVETSLHHQSDARGSLSSDTTAFPPVFPPTPIFSLLPASLHLEHSLAPPPHALPATTPGHDHATKEGGGSDEEAAHGGTEGAAPGHAR
jgi:hypothetical protein